MTSQLETLRREFGGSIIEPGDAEYETARRTVFAVGAPIGVLRPTTVADVQAGVRFAATSGLAVSVRGGGHAFAGFGTTDGGLVIDLASLAGVTVIDRARNLVRIGGGATWGDVATTLAPLGLAISSGDTTSVGVGGLTLSGGIGWKVRRHGLALDNVVAAEVVVATGEVVRASATTNVDLFWALRGGGGNLGIVTAFEFQAHPTTDVFFGTITFPAASAETVLQGWAEYLRTAPDELTATADLANPFAGGADAPVAIHVAFDGDDPALAAAAIDPIRRLGTPLDDGVALKPYADILVPGATPPPGIRFVTRNAFVRPADVRPALRILSEVAASGRSPFLSIRSVSGAVARVPADATAYAHRDADLMIVTTAAGPEAVVEAGRPAFDAVWERLAPHVSGAYANFLSSATAEDVASVYPEETYRRLAQIKGRYDPSNLFDHNLNTPPIGVEAGVAGASVTG